MKSFGMMLAMLVLCLVNVGCSDDDVSSNMFVGTWEQEHSGNSYVILEFSNHGTARLSEKDGDQIMGTYEVQDGSGNYDYRMRFVWEGNHRETYDIRVQGPKKFDIYKEGYKGGTFNKTSNKVKF